MRETHYHSCPLRPLERLKRTGLQQAVLNPFVFFVAFVVKNLTRISAEAY